MRAKLFDMIRGCLMYVCVCVSMPDIHTYIFRWAHVCLHMCHALSHARTHTHTHTVAEQKVNSKTESTADADSSKSKPQQHDAVTFFAFQREQQR